MTTYPIRYYTSLKWYLYIVVEISKLDDNIAGDNGHREIDLKKSKSKLHTFQKQENAAQK